jgi:MoxR-like ATPase
MIEEIANNIDFPVIHIDCGVSNMNDFEDFLPFDRDGFIVFDDVNRAPSEFLSSVMKIATTRQYKSYTLPDGWVIVLVTKTVDGDTSMGSALKNRFAYVDL